MRRIFGASRRWEPKKVGSGHVLLRGAEGVKPASKAAEGSRKQRSKSRKLALCEENRHQKYDEGANQ